MWVYENVQVFNFLHSYLRCLFCLFVPSQLSAAWLAPPTPLFLLFLLGFLAINFSIAMVLYDFFKSISSGVSL